MTDVRGQPEGKPKTMPKFKIDQIAIAPVCRTQAMQVLKEIGATDWKEDVVTAQGTVMGEDGQENAARLAFNYQLCEGKEFEVLGYHAGKNWLDYGRMGSVSHFGMHVTAEELEEWRAYFKSQGINVAQEVKTISHSNPAIKDTRRYHYCIFNTCPLLGVDLKFIVRKELPKQQKFYDNGYWWAKRINDPAPHPREHEVIVMVVGQEVEYEGFRFNISEWEMLEQIKPRSGA
jgi:hypothetical protein